MSTDDTTDRPPVAIHLPRIRCWACRAESGGEVEDAWRRACACVRGGVLGGAAGRDRDAVAPVVPPPTPWVADRGSPSPRSSPRTTGCRGGRASRSGAVSASPRPRSRPASIAALAYIGLCGLAAGVDGDARRQQRAAKLVAAVTATATALVVGTGLALTNDRRAHGALADPARSPTSARIRSA